MVVKYAWVPMHSKFEFVKKRTLYADVESRGGVHMYSRYSDAYCIASLVLL